VKRKRNRPKQLETEAEQRKRRIGNEGVEEETTNSTQKSKPTVASVSPDLDIW
jgi:hypothetical protein